MSSRRNSRCAPNPRRTERGSAIITVLILAAVTAVIAAGFMFRSSQEAKLATRSYFQSVALNLAEAGLEEGLYAANTVTFAAANGWTLVTGSTTDYQKTITTGLDFTQATGAIYIRVDNAVSLNPTVTAAGVITIPNQPRLVKQVKIGSAKRRLWANSIVTKGTLTFSGSSAIDSYDSTLGVYSAALNRSDRASVATVSTALDPLVVGSNGSIYGYVATGGASPNVGTGGRIYGATTPVGTLVDPTRIRTDFSANLPDATTPTGTATSLSAVTHNLSLPRNGDLPGANGRYLYSTTDITMSSRDTVTITGPVDLIVTGSVAITGLAGIVISSSTTNSSLNLYCPGSVQIGGTSSLNNTNLPSNLTVWGTAPSTATQTISITGTADFTGTIYAPNAAITLGGTGTTNGAVVGRSALVSGSGIFHYDVRLGDITTSLDTSYRVTAWAELNAAASTGTAFARDNRAPFNTLF